MADQLPYPIIGVVARILSAAYTRSNMVGLFYEAGAIGEDPAAGNKLDTAVAWIKATATTHPEPLVFLGRLLRDFMDGTVLFDDEARQRGRDDINAKLAEAGYRYYNGSIVSVLTGPTTATLQELLRRHRFPAVLEEFDRATANVETEPREAASAAANILEAICKEYMVQHPHLTMPAKQDLRSVFGVVREDLGFDPSALEDDDLKRVLGGLLSVVDGISALRTHASSAHAQGTSQRYYRLEPRHARAAIGAAHTLVAFIMETWRAKVGSGR